MSRKLASIQKILNIEPIEGADLLEKATVLGWQCVVKKHDFKIGDWCVYIEVDAALREGNPAWQFLIDKHSKQYNEHKVHVVKTIRLRKQISQGICFPLSILPAIASPVEFAVEGLDVSEILQIEKYEPPVPAQLAGVAKGNFPSWISKTDETRIQAEPWLLENFKDTEVYVAEKIDGSSMTVYLKDDIFGVCSRNLDLKETEDNSFWKIARKLDLETKLRKMLADYNLQLAIQGELVGPGIQKNKLLLTEPKFYVFNVYDVLKDRYLDHADFESTTLAMELDLVPVIQNEQGEKVYRLGDIMPDVTTAVKFATRKSVVTPSVWAEGVVIRPTQEQYVDRYGRLSFKVINPEFLLKDSDE